MQLEQETRSRESGYAMVGLLVGIALLTISLSVALPVWRTMILREKEAELLWRGQQYDRALQLYRRKTGAPGPPNLDVLVKERYLRKKYKDPIANDDFELVPLGAPNAPGVRQPRRGFGQLIGGVRSKSKKRSLRVVNGKQVYNEWQFTYEPFAVGGQPTAPGEQAPPGMRPGSNDRRPGMQRDRGTSPFGRGRPSSGGGS